MPAPAPNTVTLVVADDHPPFIEGLAHALPERFGIRVVACCADGHAALAAIKSHQPTIALVDLRMPGLDGDAVVREVVRLDLPAVALVANGSGDIDQARYDGVRIAGTAYALVLVVFAVRRPEPLLHWRRFGVIDLALVGALVHESGGSDSPLDFAYFAIPFLVAFVARPAETALWSVATSSSYVVVTRPHDGSDLVEVAQLAFAAVGAVAFSAVLVRLHSLLVEHLGGHPHWRPSLFASKPARSASSPMTCTTAWSSTSQMPCASCRRPRISTMRACGE